MRKSLFIISLLSLTITCHSQSKQIIGSWILKDPIDAMQFLIKENGTIEQRRGLATENIWTKTPRQGTYKFNDKGKLVITWSDKSIEHREVKFENNFKAANIIFLDKKDKYKKSYLFLRIIDSDIIIDK
ncbi:MAG: hypothetical protein WCK60_03615 [Candidatus Nomurabacteria bacterium]